MDIGILLAGAAGSDVIFACAMIGSLGLGAQWLAWRLRLPSILLLLVIGFVAGPEFRLGHVERQGGSVVPFWRCLIGRIGHGLLSQRVRLGRGRRLSFKQASSARDHTATGALIGGNGA